MVSIMRGKKHADWVAQTFCDFGTPGRRTDLTKHYSVDTGRRLYKRILKVYHDFPAVPERENWRCWLEMRDGSIIEDTANEPK